jgi:phosphoribosyl 1,2-cyclic phosphodiesterase
MDAIGEQCGVEGGGSGGERDARLCVLGSGSKANCAVLHTRAHDGRADSVCLIDLGYSPRMTDRLLREVGLSLDMVTAVLLTHLDSDHCHAGWNAADALPRSASLFLHEGHLQRAYVRGLNGGRLQKFTGARGKCGPAFTACEAGALAVHPMMTFHDDLGAAVFRVQIGADASAPAFGYATDLGRVTDELIGHLSYEGTLGGVDTLVIESNYCPKLQVASDRPEFLKRRVMGGRGHLSNEEALEAIEAIAPREHVVLVHLSQQCNDPALVASLHEGCVGGYTLTISQQDVPTRWVPVRRKARTEVITRRGQLSLWAS